MDAGRLVPDDLVLGMLEGRMRQPDARRGWLLDGFPRTLVQANGLIDMTQRVGQPVDAWIVLNVSAEIVVRRLGSRRLCENCQTVTSVMESPGGKCRVCGGRLIQRSDDATEVVRRRIKVFEEQTRPVFELFRGKYEVIEIDASLSRERVTEALRVSLDRYDHP
jgi:adenylate kinase